MSSDRVDRCPFFGTSTTSRWVYARIPWLARQRPPLGRASTASSIEPQRYGVSRKGWLRRGRPYQGGDGRTRRCVRAHCYGRALLTHEPAGRPPYRYPPGVPLVLPTACTSPAPACRPAGPDWPGPCPRGLPGVPKLRQSVSRGDKQGPGQSGCQVNVLVRQPLRAGAVSPCGFPPDTG